MIFVSTPPAIEPVTLDQAKAWLKLDWSTENDLIETLITAAREAAEQHTNRAFISQGITETFPVEDEIILSVGDVISIDSVTVGETSLTIETDYTVKDTHLGKLITLTNAPASAPVVVYTAGYGESADDVPKVISQAMKLMIADWYDNRTDKVKRLPTSSEHLLNKVRRWIT